VLQLVETIAPDLTAAQRDRIKTPCCHGWRPEPWIETRDPGSWEVLLPGPIAKGIKPDNG
jgi:hypothetical protein